MTTLIQKKDAFKIVTNDFDDNMLLEHTNSGYYMLTQSNYKKAQIGDMCNCVNKQMITRIKITVFLKRSVQTNYVVYKNLT